MSFEKGPISKEAEPKSVLEYLAKMHQALASDYRTSEGIESCTLIAFDVAKLLLAEGRKPELFKIKGKKVQGPYRAENSSLKPLQYQGRVEWFTHVVCVSDGKVYDPILEQPVPLEQYAQRAFGDEVEMEAAFSTEYIEQYG